MRRGSFVLGVVCAAFVAGSVSVAGAQSDPPADCFQTPTSTCLQDSDGNWTVEPGAFDSSPGDGIPGEFFLFGGLIVLGGIGVTLYKMSMARQMAAEAGMDPDRAAAVTLLDDGLDATYIATSLRGQSAPQPAAPPSKGAAHRLRELQQLRDDGLVTPAEYEARRRAIVESV
jgi:Short C-terminal domain